MIDNTDIFPSVQSDEADMGMTYDELTTFGR